MRPSGRPVRRVVTLAVSACLFVSCSSTEPPGRESGPERPTATAGTPDKPSEQEVDLPTVPATDDAAELARQLNRAGATLRARDAEESDVRRAAEFQQVAVRALATAPAPFRREVTGLLDRATARSARGDVRAASLLLSMTEPQPKLPDWRIVAPPPASELQADYRRAQRLTGVPWTYLAAVHLVETRMGRIRGVSTAGAEGPMQFLPSTWDLYGAGGDINDPRDAILAAARLLKANGAPGDIAGALWHYNPSDQYVGAVLEYARAMQRSPTAYDGYWHWRVLYLHRRGTFVLPVGYPEREPVLLANASG